MNKRLIIGCIATMSVAILIAMPAAANSFTFSTGNPDGLIATLSRVASAGKLETETADDFVTTQATYPWRLCAHHRVAPEGTESQ